MKQILILIIVILFSFTMFGAKVATLPDLLNPGTMSMDDRQLYVVEKTTIYIYSLKDFKLVKKFGKAGEGPKEFRLPQGGGSNISVQVFPQKNNLFISSVGKILYFTKDGNFIKEFRTPPETQLFSFFQPFGDKIIGLSVVIEGQTNSSFVSILYNNRMAREKELSKTKYMQGGSMEIPPDVYSPVVWNNKMAIREDGKGISVGIYDLKGKKTASIVRACENLKLTQVYKDRYFEMLKNEPAVKPFIDYLKKITKFKEFLPPIQNLYADNNTLYILTFKENKGQFEFFIYDFNGKFIKQVFLPFSYSQGIMPDPTTIKNGKLYQLIENSDTEEWELHMMEIK
jgi:hypothetical protein